MSESITSESSFPTEHWMRWNGDIHELRLQVTALFERRRIWRAYVAACNSEDLTEAAGVFHAWIALLYSDAMSIGIRRLVDRDPHNSPVSLYELIMDLSNHAEEVTAENFLKVWQPRDNFERERALGTFRSLFPVANGFLAERIKAEAEMLRWTASSILVHADKRIAHNDRKKSTLPTWKELDEALDVVAQLFKRYFLLITCGQYLLEDLVMPFGWEDAIRRACSASVQRPNSRT